MTAVAAIIFLIVLLGLWFGAPHLWRKQRERALAQLCRKERAIVLTYDDGPGQRTTPRLRNLLRQQDARASFFVLGRQAVTQPDVVASLLSEGHEIGSHTVEHSNAWKVLPHTAERDCRAGARLVDRLGGEGRLFRPPYGKLTLAGLFAAWREGLRLAWWTIDSGDSWRRRPIEEVVGALEAAGGGVVLMHDGDAYERAGPDHAEYVIALTERVVRHARAGGYRLMRLGELLDLEGAGRG